MNKLDKIKQELKKMLDELQFNFSSIKNSIKKQAGEMIIELKDIKKIDSKAICELNKMLNITEGMINRLEKINETEKQFLEGSKIYE